MKSPRPMHMILAAVVLVAGSLAFTAGRLSPPQAVIAIVDLQKILVSLDEWKDLKADIQAKGDAASKKVTELQKKLKAEEEAVRLLPRGPQYYAALERMLRLGVELKFETEYQRTDLARMAGEMLRGVYASIDKGAEDLAKKNGYSIVLASDEQVTIPENIPPDDINRIISLKRMLYIDPAHDITDELLVLMNNQYAAAKAAGGKAGANAAPKP
ncbi:MAG: OmpH family outer membrane protein [Phycisphaeraceae bacterium]|nr:OmpH family outer membrane protein [Phycisphaeraceae bacterium]